MIFIQVLKNVPRAWFNLMCAFSVNTRYRRLIWIEKPGSGKKYTVLRTNPKKDAVGRLGTSDRVSNLKHKITRDTVRVLKVAASITGQV